jgi:hypothetical protein
MKPPNWDEILDALNNGPHYRDRINGQQLAAWLRHHGYTPGVSE